MARRRKKQTNSSYAIAAVVLVFGWIFLDMIRSNDFAPVVFVVGLTALVGMVLYGVVPKWRRERLFDRVDAVTDGQIDALIRQRTILVRSDAYGKPLLDKWYTEVNYFISHHVRPNLGPSQVPLLEKQRSAVLDRIAQRVALSAQQRPATPAMPASMNGAEFEAFCAAQLRAYGWSVQLTPLCRDQGVDVIAEKNRLRVALQCKLYSKPVGNKAVQEIAAGRVHQRAQHGAVVTNGTFTASAKELAATNGIRLLHHSDLPQLETILSKPIIG
jgi:restriction system protein